MNTAESRTVTFTISDPDPRFFDTLLDDMEEQGYALQLTQQCGKPAPLKPIKGVHPWGVGKKYRRCRRQYAQAMRKHKRDKTLYTVRTYVPNAQVSIEGTGFVATPKPEYSNEQDW